MGKLTRIFPWIIYLSVTVCGEQNSRYTSDSPIKCEPLTTEMCPNSMYNETILPNVLGHVTQHDAEIVMQNFFPLLEYGCSPHLRQFLCVLLFPPCTILEYVIPPCKSLCQLAADTCIDVLINFGFELELLDCEKNIYPVDGICIGTNVSITTDSSDVTVTSATTFGDAENGDVSMVPNVTDASVLVNLFLLATSGHKIQILDVISATRIDTITVYSGIEAKLGAALDFYMPGPYLYWASSLEGRIYRGRLVMDSLREVRTIVDTGSATVESLAVDWLLGVLFWTESFPASLKTSSLSGRRVTTLLSRDMEHPISLTLDPVVGKVFWIDRRGDVFRRRATIEYYSLVTETRGVVFNVSSDGARNAGRPNALVADIAEKRLFWADARSESLHSNNYDGTNHRVLLKGNYHLQDPDSVTIYGNHVIWTDRYTGSLVWANKHDGSDKRVIKTFESHPPLNIKVFQQKSQPSGQAKYDKSVLTSQWQELSSRESMELPDEQYDYYNEEYDRREGDKKRDKKKGGGTSVGDAVGAIHAYLWVVVSFSSIVILSWRM